MTTLAPHQNYYHHHQDPRLHHRPSLLLHPLQQLQPSTSSTSDHLHSHISSSINNNNNNSHRSSCLIDTNNFDSHISSHPSSQQLQLHYPSTTSHNHRLDLNTHNFNNLAIDLPTPMQSAQPSGSWNFAVSNGQLTPTSARTPRNGHHRESSLSSIGSAGPSSPYNASTSNPHIILQDNESSYYDGLPSAENYHTYSKPLTPHGQTDFLYGYNDYNPSNLAAFMALQKQQDTESMPAPDYTHARSVASTHDSPATPSSESMLDYKNVPKLDRTMSDAYNDELYSPNFAFTSAPTSKPHITSTVPQNDLFSQTLQAANNQHLSATSQAPSQTSTRQLSPFRQGSPLAPTNDGFGGSMRLASAQQIRQQQKAENDAMVLAQQMKRSSPQNQVEEKTISPKDALLDYHGNDDATEMPLFPVSRSPCRPPQQLKIEPSMDMEEPSSSQQSMRSMATSRRESSGALSTSSQITPSSFAFAPPSVPGVQIPQQYPFVPQPRREQSNMSAISATPDFPSTLTSMESSSSDFTPENKLQKPAGATADGGTYSCTYHGCTLRFETPAKLQKHKREGHRQSVPARSSGSPDGSGMTSAANRNSQAGPHKCERINPSTGKPCNTIFSRPYDLTRHETTIHDRKSVKLQCKYCSEKKEFSRQDALTRHMRVVHPEIPDPKQRRRG